MNLPRRWRIRLALVFWTLLVILALDLGVFSYDAARSSRLLLLGAVLLAMAGITGFVATIVFTRRSGIFYRRRQEIALACISALISLTVVLTVSFMLRILPQYQLAYERWDPDIGSVPGDDEKIGGRFETIDPNREQVLIIGDSITVGWTLPEEEVVGRRLEKMVSPYQVLNLSKTGWSIDQYYLYLKRVLPRTRPKLVIVGIFAGNDYEVTGRIYSWGHTKPMYRMKGDELIRVNPNVLEPNCYDHLAQSLLFRPLWADHALATDAAEFFCRPDHPEPAEVDRVIGKLFSMIEDESRHFGAPVLFVLLPGRKHWFREAATDDCSRYQQRYGRLLDILEAGHHPYYEFMIDLLRNDPQESSFLDDGSHLNGNGHRLLAEALAKEIQSRHLLAPPAATD